MGRQKIINSNEDIVKNTLFGTIYEKFKYVESFIDATYFETIEKGHRMEEIKSGIIILRFINEIYKIVVCSDCNYSKNKVLGYFAEVFLYENDENQLKKVEPYFIRKEIEKINF